MCACMWYVYGHVCICVCLCVMYGCMHMYMSSVCNMCLDVLYAHVHTRMYLCMRVTYMWYVNEHMGSCM